MDGDQTLEQENPPFKNVRMRVTTKQIAARIPLSIAIQITNAHKRGLINRGWVSRVITTAIQQQLRKVFIQAGKVSVEDMLNTQEAVPQAETPPGQIEV